MNLRKLVIISVIVIVILSVMVIVIISVIIIVIILVIVIVIVIVPVKVIVIIRRWSYESPQGVTTGGATVSFHNFMFVFAA